MMGKDYFTTNDIALMSNVTRQTVINWFKSGKLRANLTPGGHRRVRKDDLVAFFSENQLEASVVEDYERRYRKRIPSCWEYFAAGFPKRTSKHECECCLVKEARAQRCYVLGRILRKEGDFCHTDCGSCTFYKRYADAFRGASLQT